MKAEANNSLFKIVSKTWPVNVNTKTIAANLDFPL